MSGNICRACGSDKLTLLFDLGPQPLAGGFLSPENDIINHEKQYPLPIHVCQNCGLVQTTYVIPSDKLFTNYRFSSSTITYLVEHFSNYAAWIKKKYNPKFVVEFGCNDGVLLSPLKNLGVDVVGVDISHNITKLAREKGLNVITGYFDIETAKNIREENGLADFITGSNAFPHNDCPEKILIAAQELLQPDGHICVEVMYAGSLLEKTQWDSMYHEHLSYFCLTTIDILFRRYGFHAVHAEILPMHAGSLRVVAAKNQNEEPDESVAEILCYESENGVTDIVKWKTFAEKTNRQIKIVQDVLGDLAKHNRIWGYGAAGRATMWVNACKMNYLEAIVDESPFRAGRLMPGTHTPIVYPSELKINPPDYILTTAWNYFDQIREKESWFNGIWIIPVPELRFV